MNLTDIKKKADAKIAEANAKQEEARRLRELDIHPLVKWKCDRNVREAYFQGVVFAALTNDLKIDEAEQKILSRIGNSLAIPKDEQSELTALVQKSVDAFVKAGGADVFAPLEDCVRTFKGENVVKLFVAEYVKVCGVRELDVENVREQLADHIAPQTGVSLKPTFVTLLHRVVSKGKNALDADLVALADVLDDDLVRYFVLDVLGTDIGHRLMNERKRAKAAAVRRAEKEQERIAAVLKAYQQASRALCELWKHRASLPDDYDEELKARLSDFDERDIDYVSCVNNCLTRLQRAQDDLWGTRKTQARRVAVLKLMCLVYVSGETVDPSSVDDLLRDATRLSDAGFVAKIESFIGTSLSGVVDLG